MRFKKWYIPGIISAIFVPVLFYLLSKNYIKSHPQQFAFEIHLFNLNDCTENISNEFVTNMLNSELSYDYKMIGIDSLDNKIINNVQATINEMRSKRQINKGLLIQFSPKSSLQTVICLHELCYMNSIKRYINYEDKLLMIPYLDGDGDRGPILICGTGLYRNKQEQKGITQYLREMNLKFFKAGKEILILYFTFVLAIIWIQNRNNKKTQHLPSLKST